MTDAAAPQVSVVIPTVDRVDLLARCLDGVARQDAPAGTFDVLVVHDGNPGVEALLAERGVAGLRIAERGAVPKRNAGWRAAAAAIVAFTDDDCEPSPTWVTSVLEAFADDPSCDLVQGPTLPHPADEHVGGLFKRTISTPELALSYPGANLSFRRAALEAVDGFDPSVWGGGEDTDLAWRVREAGGSAGFHPGALVWHAVRPCTFGAHLRSLPRWGSLPLVVGRHPRLRAFIPHGVLWKDAHRTAVPAAIGIVAAAVYPRRPLGLALLGLHVAWRARTAGPRAALPLVVSDLAEVAIVTAGSVRHRKVLL